MLPENSMWLVCLGKGIGTNKDDYSTGKGALYKSAEGCNLVKELFVLIPARGVVGRYRSIAINFISPQGELIRKSYWLNQAVKLNL